MAKYRRVTSFLVALIAVTFAVALVAALILVTIRLPQAIERREALQQQFRDSHLRAACEADEEAMRSDPACGKFQESITKTGVVP